MRLARFAAGAAAVMALGDLFMIPQVMRPFFANALGDQMLTDLRLGPAALFYLIHLAGLVWFAGRPAVAGGSVAGAVVNGAALGFVAYGCYEMTSWTIMTNWHAGLVVADMVWGTVLSGAAAGVGALVARPRALR